jgi:AraC family transcriptional regulator, regulatory protein of adaptative response / methylated-DNA-[protein]-cysteine methyltransferase
MSQYQTIAKAIGYINEHQKEVILLDDLAEFVDLSPSHLQKLFTEWAGVSPKQFQRFLSLQYAKSLLAEQKSTIQTSFLAVEDCTICLWISRR